MGAAGPSLVAVVVVALSLTLPIASLVPAGPPGPRPAPFPYRILPTLIPDTPPASAPAPSSSPNGEGRLSINTTDPGVMPNDGLRVNLTAFASTIVDPETSFQAAASETIGGYDAVFGIFENSIYAPVAFFSVFSNQTNANVHLAYWTTLVLVTGASYDFALRATNGTTWNLTVNGATFGGNATAGSFDFGVAQSTWLGGLSFTEVALFQGQTTVPTLLSVPLALAVHRPSGWYLPQSGSTYFQGLGSPPWGVEGRLQHPTLAPGEVETGISVPSLSNGTALWTGGPAPVDLTISLPTRETVGTEVTLVDVEVTDPSGAPIPGVALYLNDSLGGSYTSPSLLTNGTGGATSAFETPNVSATSNDLVQATVTSLGYDGYAGVGLTLTPPVEVVVDLGPGATTVVPSGTLLLEFTTHDAGGAPQSGVFLSFSVLIGAGTFSPEFGTTDSAGDVSVLLSAPSAPSTLTIEASVADGGEWGHRIVVVSVENPKPSFWGADGPAIEAIALVGAIALLVAVVWRTRRRRRKALPAMPIRQYWREVRSGSTPAPAGPVSRTPPSGGGP
jgi:hypothetical protein